MSAERTSRAAIAAEQLCAALWEALHEQLKAGDEEQAAALADRIAEVSRSVAALARLQDDPQPPPPAATEEAGGLPGAVIVDEQEDPGAPIAIRDARRSGDGSPWSVAVQRRLARYEQDREPFAVLLLELLDAERLRRAQSPQDAQRQVREVEAAMVGQLRPADALIRESDGRYWLTAPGTDEPSAHTLGIRLAAAARRSASHRGAPLEVAVGIACCPEHGIDAATLVGHAEVDLYAAEAGGNAVNRPDDGDPAA